MSRTENAPERLRAVMEAREITQSDVAKGLDIGQSMISQYLSGKKPISDKTLIKFAQFLDIDFSWLKTGAPPIPDILLEDILQKSQWVFRPQHPDGGKEFGNADVWAIPWDLSTLVREVIQNTLDARESETDKVSVDFSLIELTGTDRDRFMRAADLEDTDDTPNLLKHIESSLDGKNKLAQDLASGIEKIKESEKLLLLRVEDRGPMGLTGEEYGEGNYTALVRNLLDTQKLAASAGGAYGLGKAVLWRASMLSTVFFNSIPIELHDGEHKMRLIGKTDLPHHTVEGIDYAGPGWFGYGDTRGGDEIVAAQSVRDSLELADELYISRETGNFGTSILVVGFYNPSSDEEEDLHRLSEEIIKAAANNCWPALLYKNLDISVSTWRGRKKLTDIPVNPEEHEPDYTDMLYKYEVGDLSEDLIDVGDVVAKQVFLEIPRRKVSPKHDPDQHAAVLLIREDSIENGAANEVVYYRSPGTIVGDWSIRPPSLGGRPFRAVLITGQAVNDEVPSERAEIFLKAAEPPAHDNWTLTPEIKNAYQRGGGAAIRKFFNDVRETVYEVIKPNYDDSDNQGPKLLADLLRIMEPQSPKKSKPSLRISESRLEDDYSWFVRAIIHLPSDKNWRITPSFRFAAETGRGVQVPWHLEAVSGCEEEDGVLIIPRGTAKAEFIGRTEPKSNPSTSYYSAVDIALTKITSE